MTNILKRLFLIRGPKWHALYLLVFYLLIFDFLVVFTVFFSLPPGPASAMSARMDRALMFPALGLMPLNLAAAGVWILTSLGVAIAIIRGKATEQWGIVYAILPFLEFVVLSRIYGAFLSGSGTVIHEILYNL